MEQIPLTLSLPRDLVTGAERYAETQGTSLARLIALYLHKLVTFEHLLDETPAVCRMPGILPSDASVDDYYAYLAEKYEHPAET